MNRRNLFKSLAGLIALPLLPLSKLVGESKNKYENHPKDFHKFSNHVPYRDGSGVILEYGGSREYDSKAVGDAMKKINEQFMADIERAIFEL